MANAIARARADKQRHPDRYCQADDRCLWITWTARGRNPCRKHEDVCGLRSPEKAFPTIHCVLKGAHHGPHQTLSGFTWDDAGERCGFTRAMGADRCTCAAGHLGPHNV